MKKTIIFIILALVSLTAKPQEKIPVIVQANAENIFRVQTYDASHKLLSEGAGFFIDSLGTFITALHIVKEGASWSISNPDGNSYPVVSLQNSNTKNDLASLEIDWPTGKDIPILVVADFTPVDNDPVYAFGFENGQPINYEGLVSSIKMSQQLGQILLSTIPVFDDLDGSPMFNEKAEVIGMFSTPLAEKYELNLAISYTNFFKLSNLNKTLIEQPDTLGYYSIMRGKYGQNFELLKEGELNLQAICDTMIDGWNMFVRLDAMTDFIPLFRKVLAYRGSYNYPFDSLKAIKIIQPTDNKFRIFNWTLKFDEQSAGMDRILYRYYGAIQLNNPDSLELIPLFDGKKFIENGLEEDTILNNEGWYGVQYYDAGIYKVKGKTYYLLLGWDGNDFISDKKIIEILSFDNDNMPMFGAPLLKTGDEFKMRKIFQYNDASVMTLELKEDEHAILFDHLAPENPKYKDKEWLFVPNGSYDYYKIKKKYLLFKEGFYGKAKSPDKYAKQ